MHDQVQRVALHEEPCGDPQRRAKHAAVSAGRAQQHQVFVRAGDRQRLGDGLDQFGELVREEKRRVAAALAVAAMLTSPGIPFTYHGEEIGLSQSEPVSNSDQSIRGPMSWTSGANAGFS